MDPVRTLASYPLPLRGVPEALPGGYSGARVWRLRAAVGTLCLRAGAAHEPATHLRERHQLMRLAREAGLVFVPIVLSATNGDTVVSDGDRAWELMDWMAGAADFHDAPTKSRLREAAGALGRLHVTWRGEDEVVAVCPAIARRLDAADRTLLRSVANPLVDRWLRRVPAMLAEVTFPVRVQPCLRDVWHDNLLFTGDRLTGLVDYASMGTDSVAADLARMLGSLVGDDDGGWRVGLAAYREHAPLSGEEERLARALDRAGVVLALVKWLGQANDVGQRRVEELSARIASWGGG